MLFIQLFGDIESQLVHLCSATIIHQLSTYQSPALAHSQSSRSGYQI